MNILYHFKDITTYLWNEDYTTKNDSEQSFWSNMTAALVKNAWNEDYTTKNDSEQSFWSNMTAALVKNA